MIGFPYRPMLRGPRGLWLLGANALALTILLWVLGGGEGTVAHGASGLPETLGERAPVRLAVPGRHDPAPGDGSADLDFFGLASVPFLAVAL